MEFLTDIKAIAFVVDVLKGYSDKERVRTNEAITAIQTAWLRTYDYLRNQKGEYIPNPELSELWNIAAGKTRLVNADLASRLSDKSRFWIHPDLPRQNRIINLIELTDEMERLNLKFKK